MSLSLWSMVLLLWSCCYGLVVMVLYVKSVSFFYFFVIFPENTYIAKNVNHIITL